MSALSAWRLHKGLIVPAAVHREAAARVRFEKDGHIATFHRPHPAKEAKPYQVRESLALHRAELETDWQLAEPKKVSLASSALTRLDVSTTAISNRLLMSPS
jgi:hypothetical protein